jgi:3-phenylpropionate/trans-cinnamate dioxygenase ferredoxin reductase subunit
LVKRSAISEECETMAGRGFVIVGAGLAGAKAAEALREQGYDGTITLVGDEQHRPYERPPLSKDYLAGKAERDSVFVHTADWYDEHNVTLRSGVTATAIDRGAHRVDLSDGSSVEYDKLLLATGATPRALPGADGVLYLRRIEDSDRIRQVLSTGGPSWSSARAGSAWRSPPRPARRD